MKTSELNGAALDWAVAKCEGLEVVYYGKGLWYGDSIDSRSYEWHPVENWSQGGPIIERENIGVFRDMRYSETIWVGQIPFNENHSGPSPLIAAMRCYVSSQLGDEVEVPKELQ